MYLNYLVQMAKTDIMTRDVKSCQIRHPDVRVKYPADTSGCSYHIMYHFS